MKKEVFVDVDGVCANLAPIWLRRYNMDYNDILTEDMIIDWDIHKFVKSICGHKIYEYLKDPRMYDMVYPIEGALKGINELRELGYRVLFATSCAAEVAGRKFYWLKEWGFIKKERDYIEIRDKGLLRGKYMIDDGFHNVNAFTGRGYLLTRPWNKSYLWYHRVGNWDEFLKHMKRNIFVDAGYIG